MFVPSRMPRPAFSLMEMILALAIAMILLGALYITLSTQILHLKGGRDIVFEGALARNILTAIANDINGQVGPVDPRLLPNYNPQEEPDPEAMPMPMPAPVEFNPARFNLGVYGEEAMLMLSGSRVQKQRIVNGQLMETGEPASDLRRVSYWIVEGPKGGLARHELKQATANDIDLYPTELPDQDKHVIAREVKSISFEYFDGASWQTSWDGSSPVGDDGTILGPPSAVRIRLTLRRIENGQLTDRDGPVYEHVVALPTGNNFPQN